MARLTLAVLGGFEARLTSGHAVLLPPKVQALLAYLALHPGQGQPRDKLAALLWPDASEEAARHSFRQALLILRTALNPTHLPTLLVEGEAVAVDGAAVDVDAVAFERLVNGGTPTDLERAAELYRGDLLQGLRVNVAPFEEWLVGERERLHELALEGLAKLLAYHRKTDQTEHAIQTAVRLLVLEPSQEVVHRALMVLYAGQGRRGAALRQYQICVDVLRRDLGTEPEPETRRLYQDILRRNPPGPGTADLPTTPRTRGGRTRAIASRRDAEPPLIGRKIELAFLQEALDAAWHGQGQAAIVVGEAGIGKTRLLATLAANAHQRAARVILGRAYESEQVLAFGPWVDAFRTGQVSSDTRVLERLDPLWRAELGRLLPELGPSGPPTVLPGEDHLRLFEGVAHLVTGLAATQPLVLILEDVHWADEMSLRLLAFLARRIRPSQVLLVASAREEELAAAPRLRQAVDELSREPHFARLTLLPLSRVETTALVRTLAQTGTEENALARLDEQVWKASDGNPFVVVETVRAVAEGTLVPSGTSLSLPESVRQVITLRLAHLGDEARQLLAVAAVIGREFDFALLARAAGLRESEAAEGLEELVRWRVIQGVGEHLDFAHERIRDVALGELIGPRRKLLHARVAEALDEVYRDKLEPHYAALGVHYREGEVWDKALAYLRLAGAQAFRRSAYREATALFEQALEALRHLPATREALEQSVDLRFDLRNALVPLGDLERIGALLREAETAVATLDDPRRQGPLYSYKAHYLRTVGDLDGAVAMAERTLVIAEALNDFDLRIAAHGNLGHAYHARGDYGRARDVLGRAVATLTGDLAHRHLGMSTVLAVNSRMYLHLLWCLAELGEFTEGRARADEALRIAESLDSPYDLLLAYNGAGYLFLRQGDVDEATPYLERGLGLTRQAGLPLVLPDFASALGYAHALSGHAGEAILLLEEALERALGMKILYNHSLRLSWLSEAYLRAGRLADSAAAADRALELARTHKARGYEAWALRQLGEIAFHRDCHDIGRAEACYLPALELATELGMRPLTAHCHLGLGALYRRAGTPRAARAQFVTATTMFRTMGMRTWLARTEAEAATLA